MAQSIFQEKMGVSADEVSLLDIQKKQAETLSHEYPSGLKISFPLTDYAFQSFGTGNMWATDIFSSARDFGVGIFVIEIPGLNPVHAAIGKSDNNWTVEPYALTDANFFASLNDPEGVYGRDLRQALYDMTPHEVHGQIEEMMSAFLANHFQDSPVYSNMSQAIIFSGEGEYSGNLKDVVQYMSDAIDSNVFSEAALTNALYNTRSDLLDAPPKFYHDLREQVKAYFASDSKNNQFDHKIAANMIVGSAVSKNLSGYGKIHNTHVINLPDLSRASLDGDKEKCQMLGDMKDIIMSKAFSDLYSDDAEKLESLSHIGRMMNMKYATPNVVEVCGVYGILPRQDFKSFYRTQRAPLNIVNKPSDAVKLQSDFYQSPREFAASIKMPFTIKLAKAAMSSTLPFYENETRKELWGDKPGVNTSEAMSYIGKVQREKVKSLHEAGLLRDEVIAFHVNRGVSQVIDAASNLDRNTGFSFDR